MRCKQGDMAFVIYSENGNEGKIVKCIESLQYNFENIGVVDSWISEPALINICGTIVPVPDKNLRPIRPGDLDDFEQDEISKIKEKEICHG